MKNKLLLLSLITTSFCIAQDISKKKIEKWTEDYSAKAVENLSTFLSIPNNGLDQNKFKTTSIGLKVLLKIWGLPLQK